MIEDERPDAPPLANPLDPLSPGDRTRSSIPCENDLAPSLLSATDLTASPKSRQKSGRKGTSGKHYPSDSEGLSEELLSDLEQDLIAFVKALARDLARVDPAGLKMAAWSVRDELSEDRIR